MIAPEAIRRLVVRVPNWVGDAVHSLPALAALRAHFPSANITVVARGEIGALFLHHPAVDRVVSYPAGRTIQSLVNAWNAARRLRVDGYDLGIVLTNSFEGAWLLFLAAIPHRYGYATDGRSWLLTHRRPCPPETRRLHQADYYLALLAGLGISTPRDWQRLEPTTAERQAAADRLRTVGRREERSLIALCPGAGYGGAKRWPLERYAELALRLRDGGHQLVVLGAPGEGPMGRLLTARVGEGLIDLTGQTSLREAMAILAQCSVAVSNDSGLLHVATAVGTPVVAIFGPTNPDRTGPTGSRIRIMRRPVSCSPCELRECPIDHRCMEWIGADEVHEAAVAALAVRSGAREAGRPAAAAVFLDRDGTLNRDVGYLNDPDRLELLPGVEAAIRSLNRAAFRVVVVTNQSGLARGLVTEAQLQAIHQRLHERLGVAGAVIDAIYYCPHHPDAQCACRKPEGGMIEQARARFLIDLGRSYVVGDKLADVQLARRIGARGVLVRSGHGEQTVERWPAAEPHPDHIAADLSDAAQWIVSRAAAGAPSPREPLVIG